MAKNVQYEDDVLSRDIAKKLFAKFPSKFQTFDLGRIKFVRVISEKSSVFADVTKIHYPASLYTEDLFVIRTYSCKFDDLDEARQNLTIYHELMHISPIFDGTLLKHDTEDFAQILKDFGVRWTEDVELVDILK